MRSRVGGDNKPRSYLLIKKLVKYFNSLRNSIGVMMNIFLESYDKNSREGVLRGVTRLLYKQRFNVN